MKGVNELKKTDYKKVLIPVCIFGIFLFFPYFLNIIVTLIESKMGAQHITGLDFDLWYDVLAIAFPSALTYLVLQQSEQQQEENKRMQEKLERLNEKMFETELKSKIGFFLPQLDEEISGNKKRIYKHDLRKHISLIHSGDDIVFVDEACYIVNYKKTYGFVHEPMCFIDKAGFNKLYVEIDFDDDTLKQSEVELKIELRLKNSKGYRYMQKISLGFSNDNGIGRVDKFNMSIEEVEPHAD